MPRGATRNPSVHPTFDAATQVAAETKQRAFTLKRGKNEWHVVAPNANTALLDLAKHQNTEVVNSTSPKPRPAVARLKGAVSKMSAEDRAALAKLLADADAAAIVTDPPAVS